MKKLNLMLTFLLFSSIVRAQITPNITLEPVNQTVNNGGTVSFRVEATSDGQLDFQWWAGGSNQWNDGDKNGRLSVVNTDNSSTLTITNVNYDDDNGNAFTCEVKNLDNYPEDGYWINSNTASLTVLEEGVITPIITEQPQDQNVVVGQTATFTCEFTGPTNKGYQWWRSPYTGSESKIVDIPGQIEGATTSELKILNVSYSQNGQQYMCETKDLGFYPADGSWINSDAAALTVTQNKIFEGDVTLTSQAEINDFGANGYTAITGNLKITGGDITDLGPMSTIKSVGGSLNIHENYALTNLSGLDALNSVGGKVNIELNNSLENIDGLSNLSSIGGIFLWMNPLLTNIDALSNLTTTDGLVYIQSNYNLKNLDGLKGLTFIGDMLFLSNNIALTNIDSLNKLTFVGADLQIEDNLVLKNLNGIKNITSVGGDLVLDLNKSIQNLDGLSRLVYIGGNLRVQRNDSLSEFCGLYNLLNGGGFNGTYTVTNNAINPTKTEILASGPCIVESITPVITQQPENQSIDFGNNVMFQCNFVGSSNKGYQWWRVPYTGPESKIEDIPSQIEGATTSTLRLKNVTNVLNGSQYLCEVKDLDYYPEDGSYVNSNTATLTVQSTQEEILRIIYPQGLYIIQEFEVGENLQLKWISNNIQEIDIEYSIDAGNNWFSIVRNYPAQNESFDWLIPNTPSIFCKIRMSDSNNPIVSDIIPKEIFLEPTYLIIKGINKWNKLEKITDRSLTNIKFTDKLNGFTWGNENILVTQNGGNSWEIRNDYSWANLREVTFVTKNIGFGIDKKSIRKTTNGGNAWTTNFTYEDCDKIEKIFFLNEFVGYLTTYKYGSEVIEGVEFFNEILLFKTNDGGITWNFVSNLGFLLEEGDIEGIMFSTLNMTFLSEDLGYFHFHFNFDIQAGNLQKKPIKISDWREAPLYMTTNGGISLNKTEIWGDHISIKDLYNIWQIGFIDYIYGKIITPELTYSFSRDPYDLDNIYCYNGEIGWLSGSYLGNTSLLKKMILMSKDSGLTWDLQFLDFLDDQINVKVNKFYSFDGGNAWAVGSNGLILKYGDHNSTPEYWKKNLHISDGKNNLLNLAFGQASNATNSIDDKLGEAELPPTPPAGTFDARFILPNNTSTLLDLRNNGESEVFWTIQFQLSTNGYPITFSWDNENLPFGSFFLKDAITGSIVNIDMKLLNSYTLTNESINRLQIVYKEEFASNIAFNKDWDLISVPLKAEDMEVSSIYSDAESQAFYFDNQYKSISTLENGKGYWVKFNTTGQTNIYGEDFTEPIQVKSGWNIIGPYNKEIPIAQLSSTPNGIISSNIYGFKNVYFIADSLIPGNGYWLKVSQDGNLDLNGTSRLMKNSNVTDTTKTQPIINITLTAGDGINSNIELNIGLDSLATNGMDTILGEEELPPSPPLGAFDIRLQLPDGTATTYSDYRSIAAGCYEHIIQYQLGDSSEGLNLSWDIPEGVTLNISDMITGSLFNEDYGSGEGSFTISNKNINNAKLTICYDDNIVSLKNENQIPLEYSLSQNYPNPFNPTTKIRFGLPSESKVSLVIYNILGQQVEQLVNQELKAGYHEIEFNSSSYSSGIYFYRIQAFDYVETKKMIFLK